MIFRSKIDWWIPVLVVVSVAGCIIGPTIEGDFVAGIFLGLAVLAIEILIFSGVKYRISERQLGIRNFYRWTWIPINEISEIKKLRSFLAAPALSRDRLAVYFAGSHNNPKTIEISPAKVNDFITQLKTINPGIVVK